MIIEPDQVTLRADTEPFGEVIATIRADRVRDVRTVADITLKVGGKSLTVPREAYRDLVWPQLNSFQLHSEPGYDKHPWLYLALKSALATDDPEAVKEIRIAFHDGRIESRMLRVQNDDGSVTWEKQDLDNVPARLDNVPASFGDVPASDAPAQDRTTKLLGIKLPGVIDSVFWVTDTEHCSLQIRFPPVRDDLEQPPHAPTSVWLLRSNGKSIPHGGAKTIGISKSGYAWESRLYKFPAWAADEAIAVVIDVDGQPFAERL